MSKLTLEDAISHCLEVAEQDENSAIMFEQKKEASAFLEKAIAEKAENDCRESAAEHRQLAEWLTELKEARELLKVAAEDFKEMLPYVYSCDSCALNKDDGYECSNSALHCDAKCKWRYADEALKLIGDEPNGI